MHLLYLSLLIILSTHLRASIGEEQSQPFSMYFCDDVETLNEIVDIEIKRLFSYFTTVYLVLPNKIIFFEMPIIKKTDTKDVFGLAVYQPYYQEAVETNVDRPVVGYASVGLVDNQSVILAEQVVYELYLNENSNRLSSEMYRLNFDRIQGSREILNQSARSDRLHNSTQKAIHNHSKVFSDQIDQLIDLNDYFIADHFANYILAEQNFFEIKTYPSQNGENAGRLHYCEILDSSSIRKECKSDSHRIDQFTTERRIRMFTTVQKSFKEWESKDFDMLLLDDKNDVYISGKKIGFSGSKMVIKENNRIGPLKFDELLGCHRKFKNEREIKGIYYSQTMETFYVIINRYYLKITTDLVASGFEIADSVYKNALSLKLISATGYPTLEILETKWVKTLRFGAVLVTNTDTFCDLNSNKFSQNDLFMSIEGNSIVKCDHQTLSIDGNVFCFDEEEYWYFAPENKLKMPHFYRPAKRHRITNIFESSPVNYDEDERLRFTFNYKKDKFVLMTTDHLFVLDYNRFSVDTEKRITFNPASDDEFSTYINRFLSNDARMTSIIKRLKKVIRWSLFLLIIAFLSSYSYLFITRRRNHLSQMANHPKVKHAFKRIVVSLGKIKRKMSQPATESPHSKDEPFFKLRPYEVLNFPLKKSSKETLKDQAENKSKEHSSNLSIGSLRESSVELSKESSSKKSKESSGGLSKESSRGLSKEKTTKKTKKRSKKKSKPKSFKEQASNETSKVALPKRPLIEIGPFKMYKERPEKKVHRESIDAKVNASEKSLAGRAIRFLGRARSLSVTFDEKKTKSSKSKSDISSRSA